MKFSVKKLSSFTPNPFETLLFTLITGYPMQKTEQLVKYTVNFFPFRYPHESKSQSIVVYYSNREPARSLISALSASGFRQVSGDQPSNLRPFFLSYHLPCPVGTFSNITSQGAEGCIPCPPGNRGSHSYLTFLSCYRSHLVVV